VIAKKIPREKPGPFADLAKYVAAAKEKGEKLDDFWIVKAHAGESLDDLDMAIAEVEAQQALNDGKSDKQYHLMVSFRDEKPSAEILRDIELECAKALGFEDHPRVVGTHMDTDNFHMHVAYSRIHPTTFEAHAPKWDFPALQRVCRAMEKKYGLKVDLGQKDEKEIDQKLQKVRDLEAQTWEQSFYGYVQEHKEALLKARQSATDWQDLHEAFAKYDLVLKKRGNGLVIASRSKNQHSKEQHMKASALDRSFSKAALEKDLGPFKGLGKAQERAKPSNTYKRRPLTRYNGQERLWRRYLGQRRTKDSVTGKIFRTWREFLMYGVDDPLAMAIIHAQRKMIEALTLQNFHISSPHSKFKAFPPHVAAPKKNRTYLDVPYVDRDRVKDLGAKWDYKQKKWYADDKLDLDLFKTWKEDQQALQPYTEVEKDVADEMGAFWETALSQQDVFHSNKHLDEDGRYSPPSPDNLTKKQKDKGPEIEP
jgi:hypothetical protein